MKCERCGRDFPEKQGRFCGGCYPAESLAVVLADVLTDLLAHNAHQLVGGSAWAQQAVNRIRDAQDGRARIAGESP